MIDDKGCIRVGMLEISLPNLSCDHPSSTTVLHTYLLWFGPIVTATAAPRPVECRLELYSSNRV